MGAVCFSARASDEILDGAKRLPAPICSVEVDPGGDRAIRRLRQLWIPEER
jgi:hypothetical protein